MEGGSPHFSKPVINPYFINKKWRHRACLCWGAEWNLNPGLIDALAPTLATEPNYRTPKIKKETSPLQQESTCSIVACHLRRHGAVLSSGVMTRCLPSLVTGFVWIFSMASLMSLKPALCLFNYNIAWHFDVSFSCLVVIIFYESKSRIGLYLLPFSLFFLTCKSDCDSLCSSEPSFWVTDLGSALRGAADSQPRSSCWALGAGPVEHSMGLPKFSTSAVPWRVACRLHPWPMASLGPQENLDRTARTLPLASALLSR